MIPSLDHMPTTSSGSQRWDYAGIPEEEACMPSTGYSISSSKLFLQSRPASGRECLSCILISAFWAGFCQPQKKNHFSFFALLTCWAGVLHFFLAVKALSVSWQHVCLELSLFPSQNDQRFKINGCSCQVGSLSSAILGKGRRTFDLPLVRPGLGSLS